MNKLFMKAEEIQEELGISKTYAYKIIKELNEELEKMGYKTLAGRVSRKFFNEKFYGINENAEEKILTRSFSECILRQKKIKTD